MKLTGKISNLEEYCFCSPHTDGLESRMQFELTVNDKLAMLCDVPAGDYRDGQTVTVEGELHGRVADNYCLYGEVI